MQPDLFFLDATELAAAIREKRLSPVEIVRAHLDRIEAVNPRINAVVTLMADQAMAAARVAEAEVMRGVALGPLHGVPFTIKDSLDSAGVRTARGSRLFEAHVPEADATAVARLKAAGAIPLAKTNIPEFSFWTETDNLVTGRTLNPWNFARTAGGSTGGEAAAIAAGLSPLGLGSDVAISIRGPAHYCGIVGLKATHGLIPFTGHWPAVMRRSWGVGPMARRVRDVALALSVLAGPDGHDGYASARPTGDRAPKPDDGLVIGVMAETGFGPVDPDVVATVTAAARALAEIGCRVEPARVPELESRDWNLASGVLSAAEVRPYFANVAAGREAELHPVMRRVLARAKPALADYVAMESAVEDLRAAFAKYFGQYDVLLCPVVVIPAPPPGLSEHMVAGVAMPPRNVVRATVPFNLTGLPAISVPFSFSQDGLPIGVQVVGRWYDEATVLRIAALIEARNPHRDRRPVL